MTGRERSEHEEVALTARSAARWRTVPYFTVPAAMVLIAVFTAGETTAVNVTFNAAIGATGLGAVAKILYDGQQKKRMRDELIAVNADYRTLLSDRDELRAEMAQLVGALNREQGKVEVLERQLGKAKPEDP